jgi:hypothetical protein
LKGEGGGGRKDGQRTGSGVRVWSLGFRALTTRRREESQGRCSDARNSLRALYVGQDVDRERGSMSCACNGYNGYTGVFVRVLSKALPSPRYNPLVTTETGLYSAFSIVRVLGEDENCCMRP